MHEQIESSVWEMVHVHPCSISTDAEKRQKSMAYLLHIENSIECKWKQLQASWTGSVLHNGWQIRSLLRLFYTILAPILQHLQQSSGSHSLTKTKNRIWKMFALLADGNSFDESEGHIRLIMADLFFYDSHWFSLFTNQSTPKNGTQKLSDKRAFCFSDLEGEWWIKISLLSLHFSGLRLGRVGWLMVMISWSPSFSRSYCFKSPCFP